MIQYFEIKVRYNKQTESEVKQVTELFVLEQPTFGAAETGIYKHLDGTKGDIAVLAMKTVSIDTIKHAEEEGHWHICKGKYTDIDDKKRTFVALIEAKNVAQANDLFDDAADNYGYDMDTQSVVLTKIVEVVESQH